jgi:hypothetical protein
MKIVEDLFEAIKQIPTLFRLHYHIINICFNISPQLRLQDDLNTLLICDSLVLQPKHHFSIAEDSKWSNERYFFFIVNGEANLMIA